MSTNILLVEDNPGDVFLIKEFLTGSGAQSETTQFELTQVDCLKAAFACLETDSFDLILLDLGLPDSQGLPTLLNLQGKAPSVPTVVLTGLDNAAFAAQLVQAGAQDYLIKGKINQGWLQSTIAHAVVRSKRAAEQAQQEKRLQQSNQVLQCRVRAYKEELTHKNDQLQMLEDRSTTDALTGIANRYCFDKTFERDWFQARRDQRPLSLIMIDIDYFKLFNDSCGHPRGDKCLQQVAQSFEKTLQRPSDLVARYGGEEFVVILPNTLRQGAIDIATNLGEGVKALEIRHPASDISNWVTLSLGVAARVPTMRSTPADLLDEADRALYVAKTSGRDRVATVHSSTLAPEPRNAQTLSRSSGRSFVC